MTTADPASEPISESILIVDGDIVSRHVIADYLRHCAYAVVEAANTDEALIALAEPTLSIDVILCDVSALGPGAGSSSQPGSGPTGQNWR